MASSNRANFGSRIGMILATAGGAIGLGNIWRFPYMAGDNGGALFVVLYIVGVIVLALPCIINEFIIGRHARSNTPRSYYKISGGHKGWASVGHLAAITVFLIFGFYVIVTGWCFHYVYAAISGELSRHSTDINQYFEHFSCGSLTPIFWGAIAMLVVHVIVSRGIQEGIEKASKIMMPILFILLIGVAIIACTLPGGDAGLRFVFAPDMSKMDTQVVLCAMGQAFFSMSIGVGCLCTFASYYTRDTDLVSTSVQMALLNTLVAILACLIIFPTAFAAGIPVNGGPKLLFETLPYVFHTTFSTQPLLGTIISTAFYILLVMAALTTLVSMHEVNTATLHEELHISRRNASRLISLAIITLSIFYSLSLGDYAWLKIGGKSFFDFMDNVTGQYCLAIGAFFTSILVGWRLPKALIRDEFTNGGKVHNALFATYLFLVRFVCPVCILAVFISQFIH